MKIASCSGTDSIPEQRSQQPQRGKTGRRHQHEYHRGRQPPVVQRNSGQNPGDELRADDDVARGIEDQEVPVQRGLNREIKVVEIVLGEVEVTEELSFPGSLDHDHSEPGKQDAVLPRPDRRRAQVGPFDASRVVQPRPSMTVPGRLY
jgi:hypothetical protein